MPYIPKENRLKLNPLVQLMKQLDIQADGDLNYVLFKYCKEAIRPGYRNYKNFAGELEECAAEIRRRFTGPYEDLKKDENGDV